MNDETNIDSYSLSHKRILEQQKVYILDQSKKNKKKMRAKDGVGIGFTWLFSGVTLMAVIAIFVFIFQRGWTTLSWDLLTSDYYSTTTTFVGATDYENNGEVVYEHTTGEDEYFSTRWGVSFVNTTDTVGEDIVEVHYLDPSSPLVTKLVDETGASFSIQTGDVISGISLYVTTQSRPLALGADSSNRPSDITLAQWFAESFDICTSIRRGYVTSGGDGIRGSLIATLLTIVFALLFALPLGIGGAIYLAVYAKKNKFTDFIRTTIDLLSGIPSIIFGLMGALIFIPLCSGGGSNGTVLSGALTLAIMVLPIIVKNTEEAIKVIPKSLERGSLAVGASQSQTVFKVILPNAMSGILTGTILAMGRIIGESASLIYAVGTAIQDDVSLLKPATTLAVHIWRLMQDENPNYEAACAISIVILLIVLILNLLLSILSRYLNRYNAPSSKSWFSQFVGWTKEKLKNSKKKKEAISHA